MSMRIDNIKAFAVLSFVICQFLVISAWAQFGTKPAITNFTPDIYDGHNQNWAQIQLDNDVQYFANGDGLLEFDGSNWHIFKTTSFGSLLSLDLDQSNNRIYVGGIGEIGFFFPDSLGQLTYHDLIPFIPEEKNRTFNNVWETIVCDSIVYFQTINEIMIYNSITDQIQIVKYDGQITSAHGVGNEFWFDTKGNGLYRVKDAKLIKLSWSEPLDKMEICDIYLDTFKHPEYAVYVICTTNDGIFQYNTKQESLMLWSERTNDLFSDSKITCITKIGNGQFALGTVKKGVFILDAAGNLVEQFGLEHGLASPYVKAIFEDRFGSIWLCNNEGVTLITYRNNTRLLKEGDEFEGYINSIAIIKEDIYIATAIGVYKCAKDENKYIKIDGLNDQCFDLEEINGRIYASSISGTYRIEGTKAIALDRSYARALAKFDSNGVVMGGRSQVLLGTTDGTGNINYTLRIDTFPDEVLDIAWDASKEDSITLWFGLFNRGAALMRISNDWSGYRISRYSEKQGMTAGYIIPYVVDEKVRFVTKFERIYLFDYQQNKFYLDTLLSSFMMPEEASYFIAENKKNKDVILENSGPIIYLQYDEEKGAYIRDAQSLATLNMGYANAVAFDKKGAAWIGSEFGLTRFDPYSPPLHQIPYKCLIRKAVVNGDSTLFKGYFVDGEKLSYDQNVKSQPILEFAQNNIHFEFSAPYYFRADEVEYCFELEGYKSGFSKWGIESKAFFTNLSAGSYTFRVKARNAFNNESEVGVYSFQILAPWYQTYWAYAAYIVLFAIMIYGLIKLNGRRLERANKKLQMIINQNTEEIRAQHDQAEFQRDLLEKRNNNILSSISYAKRIQEAILPSDEFRKAHLSDSVVFYKPKDIVSGDFYWMEVVGDKVFWAAVDCTGHGVPGAFMSIIGANGLKKIVKERGIYKPSEILQELTTHVTESIRTTLEGDEIKDGMDIALCCWDKSTNKLEFSGAYNPLYLIRNNELIETKATKRPIGRFLGRKIKPFENHEIDLLSGDVLFAFTDGFPDQFGGPEEYKYTHKRFRKFLLSIALQQGNMEDRRQDLEKEFKNWQGRLEQLDDVCVWGVRIP